MEEKSETALLKVERIQTLACHVCNSTRVTQQHVMKGRTITNTILKCDDCRKSYSMKDGVATEYKNRPFYGKSGTHVSRYQMGDYSDHRGI